MMSQAPDKIKKTPPALKKYLTMPAESLSKMGFPNMKIMAVKTK